MRRFAIISTCCALAFTPLAAGASFAPDRSLRPQARPATGAPAAARTTASTSTAPQRDIAVGESNTRYKAWIRAFRKRALARGISARTFDRAFRNARYRRDVIEKDRNQSEFTKQIWDYLDTATSETRVRNGRAALQRYSGTLAQVERRYGVDKQVVLAIWGLESAYGSHRGDIPTIDALSTLAFDGRRSRFFEAQLIAALKILENGDTTPSNMTGSWAGAMGHTQFMPTSFISYAADLHGDGRRDIWSDNPEDALASTANYLAEFGWTRGQPWGLEVKIPRGFNYALSGDRVKKPVSFWRQQGITLVGGGRIPDHGTSSILLPGGSQGAAFIIFQNFHVIERYNPADAYVIAVGHLGDRIMGGGPIKTPWPRGEDALSLREKKELQRRLRRKGFDVEKIDGIIGPNTIAAIRAYQSSIGQTPDGFASKTLLAKIR